MAPVVGPGTALAALAIGTTTAVLTADPSTDVSNVPYSWHFEYGTKDALLLKAPNPDGEATSPMPMLEAGIQGLQPATRYFFRVVANNADGTATSGIQYLDTLASQTGTNLVPLTRVGTGNWEGDLDPNSTPPVPPDAKITELLLDAPDGAEGQGTVYHGSGSATAHFNGPGAGLVLGFTGWTPTGGWVADLTGVGLDGQFSLSVTWST